MARPIRKESQERQKIMANDYVFFDPRKKAQQEKEDEKKLTEKEEERLRNQKTGEQAIKAIADLIVRPFVLMLVWNMTLPTFGIATITYLGAVGLYVIARILFKHD